MEILFLAVGLTGAIIVMIVLRGWWNWKAFKEWKNQSEGDEKNRGV